MRVSKTDVTDIYFLIAKVLIIVLFTGIFQSVKAFDVSPLVHELSPAVGVSSTTFLVSNTSDRALPLEFTPYALKLTDSGAIPGAMAEEALLIFPPSALIAPGAVQAVRVQWDPETALISDQAFFVVVDQVAVNIPQSAFEGVQVLISFNVVVYVKAPGSKVALVAEVEELETNYEEWVVISQEKRPGSKLDDHALSVTQSSVKAYVSILNEGTANAYGSRMSLIIRSPDRQLTVSASDLQVEFNDLFFPPDHRRVLELELPAGLWREPLSAEVRYDDSL